VTKVYVLQHVRSVEAGAEDVKFIGVYSSRENAQAAITRLSQAAGQTRSAFRPLHCS
jgi:hypothetical protein